MSKTHLYIAFAPDYTDAEAYSRRMSVRPKHLERIHAFTKSGILRHGGILIAPETLESETKKIIGSSMIFEAESVEAVRKIIEEDVYWAANVWDKEKLAIYPYIPGTPLPPVPSQL
ncbi:hypothetical protein BDW22DRAFT_1355949 [Trametopsis cervina]|nr:hypothetical protein BDW22DRAFT_1355949 [Trametopsis cervina]